MAKDNGVRVDVRGTCSPRDLLQRLPGARPLLVVDVEGFELELLGEAAPRLNHAMMIVEVHDDGDPIIAAGPGAVYRYTRDHHCHRPSS